jgi:hypothetical protein
MTRRLLVLLIAALWAATFGASAASAAPSEYAGAGSDGSEVFFTTADKLVPGDTDNGFVDVYERFYNPAPGIETFVTREISTGPIGGNDSHDVTFNAVSADGSKVFFSTLEPLVEEDEDKARDVYVRNTNTGETSLVSGGASSCAPCGSGEVPAIFVGATPSGSRVFISTDERLTGADGDEASDIYAQVPGVATPTLATPGGNAPVTFQGASADGTKVIFETTDKLAAGDTDGETDVYQRDLSGETTKLVSATGTCPAPLESECAPIYRAVTADGSRVFFETRAQLAGGDHDSFQDVYEWSSSGGTVALISTSVQGEKGEGGFTAIYAGSAAEGAKVFFETSESLSSEDTDVEARDVYERAGGTTALVTPGSADLDATFDRASPDGSTVLFSTKEALGGGDSGEKLDVYVRDNPLAVELLTPGSPAFDSTFLGAAVDLSVVFYSTAQKLSAADQDSISDIYRLPVGGAPGIVSTGPEGGNGSQVPHLSAVSDDGDLAFFTTKERLTVDDDFSGEADVYSHSEAGTRLVSVANSGELQLGPPAPGLTAVSPTSPGVTTEPMVLGEAQAGSSIKIYPTTDCSGVPVGTGSAAALKEGGIKVVVKVGSTTTFHATATNSSGDTSGCSTSFVTYTHVSTPPPPAEEQGGGEEAGGSGSGSVGGSDPVPAAGTATGSGGSGATVKEAIKIGNFVYVAPLTRITFGPAAKTRSRRPVLRFIDTTEQPNTSFFCRIDRKAWKACTSPYRLKRLALGKHVFAVKGKSFAGQPEKAPVTRRFKVVGS